ncbi:Glycosyltransferase involved in cell wall bisynthesis [Thalassovita litoralis]|jgi:glycosyltransferase involved in cell wall biosynthesis|uniref:Glycosyltransferase involved in cell wall bisynthesis n=1 Tax=Thalassovita litoralis TaxID=1010611 RepID=A0A521ENT0_9RHOB|nr:glycosyltransferase family 4 protein [Thalassovita litoralis]SMO85552.1 Glycosyltransferase involved in cell wall bisynthesis [Thalassovita litoralis]
MTPRKTPKNRSDVRIAYLCDVSPLDTLPYSGGNSRIYTALKGEFPNIDIISQSWGLAEPVHRLIYRLSDALNLRTRWRAHLILSGFIRRVVEKQLAEGQYDALFCAYSFQSLFRVRPPYPMTVVYTADATPTTYRQSVIGRSFGSYMKLSRRFDPLILKAETQTFASADLLLWPSRWLKNRADSTYGLDPEKSHVVPWGANIPAPDMDFPPPTLSADAPVRLLFVGRDWYAKGGPLTAQTVATLRRQGVDARLTVVGCTPPDTGLPDHALTVHPSLNKAIPKELALFQQQFQQAHFIMMPSFESYGFAFCEASAFGLPSLCLNAGGVPVFDCENGHALDLNATPSDYAAQIRSYLANPNQYDTLRRTTRQVYEQKLNWPAWAKTTADLIMEDIAKRAE